MAVRIIGNILAQKENYSYILEKWKILEIFILLLKDANKDLKRDVCWALTNLTTEKQYADDVFDNSLLMGKIV